MILFNIQNAHCQQTKTIIELWPGAVPGESEAKQPSIVSDNRTGEVTRIAKVTNPTITITSPKPGVEHKGGIVLCPGGGYEIVAIDKEGYEVADWLNEQGFTVALLEYRVPKKQAGALQDVQRAIRLLRGLAEQKGFSADKVGVMGFSAGGSLSARASTLYDVQTYAPIDAIDQISCKPNFAVLIYPAYLDQGEDRRLTPELKVTHETPPMFIFETADDPYGNSALVMAGALRDEKVPIELHYLPTGGHGYGLRPGNEAAEAWPRYLAMWLDKLSAQNVK